MQIVVVTIVGAVVVCLLTVIVCRRYVMRMFDAVDAVLERILVREFAKPAEITKEDRISKLMHKANRIVDMCVSEVSYTKAEKETIQSFISDMSHQMKTPLSSISMYTQLLSSEDVSAEERREFLLRIRSDVDKLQWMMDGLIKMSRLEVDAIQLSPVAQGIRRTIADAVGGILAAAAKKNVRIEVGKFEDVKLYHDKKWTQEAVLNILENAVKYSRRDGVVEMSLETLTLYTRITITDHGIGIPGSDWHRIFKRFHRGSNTKDYEGAGLGLYLATLIMEKQGGYILVDSDPGRFTSFSLF